MACKVQSVIGLGFMVAALAACDGGDTSGDTGSGGTSGNGTATGGTGNTDEVQGTIIFDGSGSWVDGEGPASDFGIQGAFFVLQDSVKDGDPVEDGLEHTVLTPAEFGEGIDPCVSGHVPEVTTADGEECDAAASTGDEVCEWSAIWGGGIGLNLKETGGEDSTQSAIDLVEAGVTGFSFKVSGDADGATIRFKITDEVNPDDDFCVNMSLNRVNTFRFSDLRHECWNTSGTPAETLDPTKARQIQWQIVSHQRNSYDVTDFCVEELAVLTD